MYELSRVRLHAIGPPGARFADVTLDLSGVGAEVTGPRQDALFPAARTAAPAIAASPVAAPSVAASSITAAEDPRQRPRRPSPATVLFLENGGGKSVLIRLIFSVVLPGRRQVVGTSNGRVLDNFVLPGDCGNVVCEWQHAVTGQRIITGKVSEWRGRVGADAGRLAEAWYSLRPGGDLEITSLPFAVNGRQVTLAGLRSRLQDAHTADPSLALAWETHQGAWSEHLDLIGLDPELFRYQRAMNAGEGEAAEAFSFGSDEQFVDFLLRAVTAPEDPEGVADVVDGYAARLAERAALDAERVFVAGALERLQPLVDAVRQRAEAGAEHGVARARAAELLDGLAARVRQDTASLDGLTAETDVARDAEREADRLRARRFGEVLTLRRRIAELRVEAAEHDRDRLVAAAAGAAAEIDAWRATEQVLRLAAATAEAGRLSRLIADAEDAAAPALADRDDAARALLRGLRRLAAASTEAAQAADTQAARHERQAAAAEATDRRASDEAATARAQEQALRHRRDEARDALAAAVRSGLLAPGDTDPARAARQAAAHADQAAAAVRDALTRATHAQDRRLVDDTTRAAEARAAAHTALDRLTGQRAALRSDAAALLADGRLAALLATPRHATGTGTTSTDADSTDADSTDADSTEADSTPEPTAGRGQVADAGAELDAVAEAGAGRLTEAIAAAEARQLELSLAADADRRLLGALGGGGLRPPRDEVTAAVEALRAAGIAAVAGWTHLAHAVPAPARERIVHGRPHLADGVVITDQTGPARVREALAAAALLPDSIVAVGAVEELLEDADPVIDGERVLLVRPNPALYDAEAAALERGVIRSRQDERAALAAELTARLTTDRDLAAALSRWRRGCPPGHLGHLDEQIAAARSDLTAAEDDLAATRRAAAAAEQAARSDLAAVEPLRAAAAQAAERATALDRLVHSAGDPDALYRDIDQAAAVVADRLAQARAARDHAGAERRAAAEAVRRADEARRNADAARAEGAAIVGASDATFADASTSTAAHADADADVPAEAEPPVAVLRAAYEAAGRTYAQVEVGADLRGEVERAGREEAAARAGVEAVQAAVRARARELLAGTSGGDSATRAAGEARARREAAAIGTDLDEARERLGALREELRAATAEARRFEAGALTGDRVPADLDQAEAMVRDASAAVAAAEREHARTRARREELVELSARRGDDLAAFGAVVENLADLVASGQSGDAPPTPTAAATAGSAPSSAFAGDAAQAREAARQVRLVLRETAAGYGQAAAAVRAAAEAASTWAAQDRFDVVRTPARRQMLRAGRETVADSAAAWAAALAPRLRSLDEDLSHIGRNREAIVARLEGMVRAALGTLRTAGRLSRLPDQLGDWSGQEFLRITFAEPDDRALTEALGQVVDDTAAAAMQASGAGGGSQGGARTGRSAGIARRDGMGLLLRGVRAAMPRGVRVEILKPDAVLRTERVRVSELGDVFSGGQQLTAAIILYCTMAALRANDRGHLRASHAGVLFLDNPIGRASAGYLLDLQLAVADRLGVQLVYTTGLFDTAALSAFPLIVRLRNDADLRAGRKYLRVEEHLRPGLTPPEPAGPAGTTMGMITATRLFARPRAAGDGAGGAQLVG